MMFALTTIVGGLLDAASTSEAPIALNFNTGTERSAFRTLLSG